MADITANKRKYINTCIGLILDDRLKEKSPETLKV